MVSPSKDSHNAVAGSYLFVISYPNPGYLKSHKIFTAKSVRLIFANVSKKYRTPTNPIPTGFPSKF